MTNLERVFSALIEYGPQTSAQLAEALDLGISQVNLQIRKLRASGDVHRVGRTGHNFRISIWGVRE